jgi:hypothetical protein
MISPSHVRRYQPTRILHLLLHDAVWLQGGRRGCRRIQPTPAKVATNTVSISGPAGIPQLPEFVHADEGVLPGNSRQNVFEKTVRVIEISDSPTRPYWRTLLMSLIPIRSHVQNPARFGISPTAPQMKPSQSVGKQSEF